MATRIDDINILRYAQRLSWAKKKANDFKWARDVADYFDLGHNHNHNGHGRTGHSLSESQEARDRMLFNYELFRGSGELSMRDYHDGGMGEAFKREGYSVAEYETLRHHDIISPKIKELIGEQAKRPFVPITQDSSTYTMSMRKKKKLELLQDYIRKTVVEPIIQRESQAVFSETGIQDPFSLPPEEQQQVQAAIAERVDVKTPDEIGDYLKKEYKSPAEIQAQTLIDYLSNSLNLKFLFDEGFKHALITGDEVYYVGVEHNEPKIQLVNPIGFASSASDSVFFIEDGEYAKYEEYITLSDVYDQFGDILTKKDLSLIDSLAITPGSRGDDLGDKIESELVHVVSDDPQKYLRDGIDARTSAGQRRLVELRSHLDIPDYTRSLIRKVHITWISARKLFFLTRALKDGKIVTFWQDESYTFDALKGDVKIEEVWVKQAWEVVKLGEMNSANGVYPIKRPIPNQYRGISNPWGVKLPYVGIKYGKLFNNTANVSVVDLLKPWQFKYNRVMSRIEEKEAMDIGKVLLSWMSLKPDEFEWMEWLMMMKYGRIAPVDLESAGITPADLSNIRTLDLSHTYDLAAQLNYLQYIDEQASRSIGLNPSRLGNVSPYTSVTNNQQNLVQSSNQTEDLNRNHNQVVENVMNVLVGAARIAYRNNPPKKSFILDDMSVAELDLDWELLWRSEIGVFVRMSGAEMQNLEIIKQRSQEMIQNGLVTFPEMVRLQFAGSPAEVINLAQKAEDRRSEQAQAAQEAQQKEAQLERDLKLSTLEKEQQMQMILEKMKQAGADKRTALDVTKFARQYDIDEDGINDGTQRQREKDASDAKIAGLDRELERKKIEYVHQENLEKLKIERIKVGADKKKKPSTK